MKSMNETYNLIGEEYSLSEVALMIAQKFQAAVTYQPWPEKDKRIESGHTVFNDSKITTTFGFSLHYNLKSWLNSV